MTNQKKKCNDNENDDAVTYWSLIRDNVPYRLYLASYLTNYFGEWLTYLSSLSAIQMMVSSTTTVNETSSSWSSTVVPFDEGAADDPPAYPLEHLISYLIVVRLMTNVIFSPLGGILADAALDRRHVLIALDLIGAVVAWLFVWAVHQQHQQPPPQHEPPISTTTMGIAGIFVATFFQQAITGGLYEPSRTALLPSLVQQDDDAHQNGENNAAVGKQQGEAEQVNRGSNHRAREQLEKATIISGVTWSAMAALGSAAGGFVVSQLGIRACFILDSVTYILSALFMYWCCRASLTQTHVDKSKIHEANKEDDLHLLMQPIATSLPKSDTYGDGDDDPCESSEDKEELLPGNNTDKKIQGVDEDDQEQEEEPSNRLTRNGLQQCISSLFSSVSFLQRAYSKGKQMGWDGVQYLYHSLWGPLVFLKFSVLWLTLDVINVSLASSPSFSSSNHDDDSNVVGSISTKEQEDAFRIGLLFCVVGVGCLLGPIIAERFTNAQRPETLQLACVVSIGISALACLCMGAMNVFLVPNEQDSHESPSLDKEEDYHQQQSSNHWFVFAGLCLFTSIRAMGVSVVWINSSLLLQIYSVPEMLGRVSSFDFALSLMSESASAVLAGRLEGDYNWTPYQVCRGLGLWGIILWMFWTVFHLSSDRVVAKGTTTATSSTDETDLLSSPQGLFLVARTTTRKY